MTLNLSRSIEDYLKAIYLESERPTAPAESLVPTAAIAHRLHVSSASATNMLKRLDVGGVDRPPPNKGARLTPGGPPPPPGGGRRPPLLYTKQ